MSSRTEHTQKPITLAMTDAQQRNLAKVAGRALDTVADVSGRQVGDLIDEAIQYAEKQERAHRASHGARTLPIHTTATLIVARAFFGTYQPQGVAEVASLRNDIRDAHLARALCAPEAFTRASRLLSDYVAIKSVYRDGPDLKPAHGHEVNGFGALDVWSYSRDVAGMRL